jgi:hypothetical protein
MSVGKLLGQYVGKLLGQYVGKLTGQYVRKNPLGQHIENVNDIDDLLEV